VVYTDQTSPVLMSLVCLFVCRKRGKKGEKNGKGLRHFSMKVCEKVQKKGVTTYNEVADELVAEFSSAETHMSPNDSVRPVAQPLMALQITSHSQNRTLFHSSSVEGMVTSCSCRSRVK